MEQQNILFLDAFKQIVIFRQILRALRHKGLVQPGPHLVQRNKFKEAGRVQRTGNFINLFISQIQVFFQEFLYLAVAGFGNFHPAGCAAFPLPQGFFDFPQQVFDIVFIHVKVAVAGQTEGNHIQYLAAPEQVLAVNGNQFFQINKCTFFFHRDFDQAGQQGRNLHHAHAFFPIDRDQLHGQVQRLVSQKREGP